MQLEYKGYVGSAEVSIEDGVNFGKLLYIRDLVSYESETASGLRKAFEEAVDDYLEQCSDLGVEPDQPYKGSFNVRVSSQLHRELVVCARQANVTLNEYTLRVLQNHRRLDTERSDQRMENWVFRYSNLRHQTQVVPTIEVVGSERRIENIQQSKAERNQVFYFPLAKMQ